MSEHAILYVPLRMKRWDSLQISYGPYTLGEVPRLDGAIGYLPVYETLDALWDAHGHAAQYAVLRVNDSAADPID